MNATETFSVKQLVHDKGAEGEAAVREQLHLLQSE